MCLSAIIHGCIKQLIIDKQDLRQVDNESNRTNLMISCLFSVKEVVEIAILRDLHLCL